MARKNFTSFLQLFGTNVVGKVCWALVLLLLIRKLGAAQFGVLATLWSAATMAAGFVDLGTNQAALREGARDRGIAKRVASQSGGVQAVLTVAIALLLLAGAWAVFHIPSLTTHERLLVIALGIATPLIDRLQALFTVYSQIGGNYAVYAWTRSAYFVVLLLAVGLTLWRGGALVAVSIVYFALTAVFALAMGLGTWRVLPPGDTDRPAPPVRQLLAQGMPFLAILTLTLAYGRIEVTLLGAMGHTASAGSFHIVYQLVLLVYSVCGIYFAVTYPRLYAHRGDVAAMTADYRDTVRWLSLLGWMTALPLWLFASPILHLLGGAPLAAHVPLLRVLAVLVLIVPASAALNFLLPTDQLGWRIVCDIAGVAIATAIATWAAMQDRLLWVAAGEVIGYGIAMFGGNLAVRRGVTKPTRTLAGEFIAIGVRTLPVALCLWFVPGTWWLRAFALIFASAAILWLTYPPIAERTRTLLAHTDA